MIKSIRMSTLSILALGTFALAGCGSQEDTIEAENESAESVAEKVAKSNIRPTPGRWEAKMTIEKLEMPDMPPEMKDMMKKQLGSAQTFSSCLTPEQAAKPNAEFFRGSESSGCTYDKFEMGGGKIDAAMTCDQNGQTQNMTMNGTYSEESYDINVNVDGAAAPNQSMAMTMAISARRVGECNGKEGQ